MKEQFSSTSTLVVMAVLVFAIAVAIPGICVASTGVKCEQKTGTGYTTCVDDGLGACTAATNGAVCGDKVGGSCTCEPTASGCLCRT